MLGSFTYYCHAWKRDLLAQSLEASPTIVTLGSVTYYSRKAWKLHPLLSRLEALPTIAAKLGSFTHYCHAWKRDLLLPRIKNSLPPKLLRNKEWLAGANLPNA